MSPDYPRHWEADVVLADGGTVHLRPILPSDGDHLLAFHGQLSEETIRYRYFAAHPTLSRDEVAHFTQVDYDSRVPLVAVLGDEIVAVGQFDRVPGTDVAEVAFVVADAHQGRGMGSVLLEHLAAIAPERGIHLFEAEVLAGNYRMARVFRDAGYEATQSYEEDVIRLIFPIEPTAASLAVMQSREHRSEALSIGRLLNPRSVAVVGAGRDPTSVGHTVLVNLLRCGFEGPVYPVNPKAEHVASVRAYASVEDVPDHVDLAVLTVPAAAVEGVVSQCARKEVRGLVIMAGGYGEAGFSGAAAERALVVTARANGMRVIGPNCLGVMSTAPRVRLNATLAPTLPQRGRAGFFCQSGALGVAVLESVERRQIGLSTFVSAGNRADVSGNDLLQYWEDDPDTDIVLLYLESFGNPRKFARLARRIGRSKPIVTVKSGGSVAARLEQSDVSDRAVDALFRQAGVIRVDTLSQLLDVATLLDSQPLPSGRRVAVVGNSLALAKLAADACAGAGLEVETLSQATLESVRSTVGPGVAIANPLVLPADSNPDALREALAALMADADVDAIVTVFVPPLRTPTPEVAEVLSEASAGARKPVVSAFIAFGAGAGANSDQTLARANLALYPSPEEAVAALARATAYAEWRRRPEGTVPSLADLDTEAARELVETALRDSPDGLALQGQALNQLLAAYGIRVWPGQTITSMDEAVAAASQLGYPVALKATAAPFRHRPELGTVRLDISSEEELRSAHQAMTTRLGGPTTEFAVQAMAPAGVATVVRTTEDPSLGALVSFGLGGVATDLLGDRAFRILPLTDIDAAELVRSVRTAPLLFGYRGAGAVNVAALEQLLLRVARLADDLPEVAELELNPVIASASGLSVLSASARVASPAVRLDAGPRRLR
ncbi:MAG: GNAT family N-acetyltransferase [Nocardioidaceae bacterium]|nr:GNAT family N-acetyltransferase [Nocardioidaceae bacterium]